MTIEKAGACAGLFLYWIDNTIKNWKNCKVVYEYVNALNQVVYFC
jgi:hypothetical protein